MIANSQQVPGVKQGKELGIEIMKKFNLYDNALDYDQNFANYQRMSVAEKNAAKSNYRELR